MAITTPTSVTPVAMSGSGSSTSTLSTGSFTPAAGEALLVVAMGLITDGGGSTTTMLTIDNTGFGTLKSGWSRVLRYQSVSSLVGTLSLIIEVWECLAPASSPSSGTVRMSRPAGSFDQSFWLGVSRTPGAGIPISANFATYHTNSGGASGAATLPGTPLSTSMLFSAVMVGGSGSGTPTVSPPAGFTEPGGANTAASGESEFEWAYDINGGIGPHTTTWTAGSNAYDAVGIVVEIPEKLPDTAPAAPGSLTARPKTSTSIDLTWSTPSDGGSAITGYEVSIDGGSYTSMSTTGNTKTITGLTARTTYSFTVRAINAIGNGTASAAAVGTTYVFFDDFSGGLGNWTIARWRSMLPDTSGDPMHILEASDDDGHLDGETALLPPDDVFIGTGGKLFVGCGSMNYGDTVLRSNTQMSVDASNEIRLDFVCNTTDFLQGNTYLYFSDTPMNAPSMTADNSFGPIPNNGFVIRLDYAQSYDGAVFRPSPSVYVYTAGSESAAITDTGHPLPISTTAVSNGIITFTRSHVTITIGGVTWFDANWTLPAALTQGWVYIGAHNHASRKYTPFYDSRNAVFSAIGWNGRGFRPRSTYSVPDRLNPHTATGTNDGLGPGMDMAWGSPTGSRTIGSVPNPTGIRKATLLVSYHIDPITNAGPFTITYSLNGNATRTVNLTGASGYGTSGSGMLVADVTVADLTTGSNTINLSVTGNPSGYVPQIGSINLLVASTPSESIDQESGDALLQEDGYNLLLEVTSTALVVADLAAGATIAAAGALVQHQVLALANLGAGATIGPAALTQHQVLAVADLAAGATIGVAGALTQHQVLAAANLAAGAGIEAGGALTQHQVLAVANLAAGATIGDAGALAQHYQALTVANLAAGATIESAGSLAQHYVALTVANLAAGATIGAAGVLTQHQVLVAAGLAAGASIEATSVVPTGALAAADLAASASLAVAGALAQHQVLAVANLAAGASIEAAGSLTQHQALAAANLAAAAAVESVALTQHQALVVANLAAGATVAAAGALTQHQALAVDGLAAGATIGAVVLGLPGTIGPANLAAAATIGPADLTQHQVLVVANLGAGATIGAAVLHPTDVLAPASLAAGATIGGAGALVQHQSLAVANLTAGSAIESPTLTPTGSLGVDNLGAGSTLAAVALTQHQQLTAANLAAGSTIESPTLGVNSVQLTVASLSAASSISPATLTANAIILVVAGLLALSRLSEASGAKVAGDATATWYLPGAEVEWG